MEASRRPLAGSRIAYSTGWPANARAVTSNGAPGSPSSTKSPFLVPTSSSVMSRSSSRDGRQDVDTVVHADLRVLPAELAVDEDVDVPPQRPALVEDPALEARVRPLELRQGGPDGRRLEGVLGAVPRKQLEGLPEANARHAGILGEQGGERLGRAGGAVRLGRPRADLAPQFLGQGGGDLLRPVGVEAHPPPGAVAGEPMGDVVVLLEVLRQMEEENRPARGGELHRRREAAVADGDVARRQRPVEPVDV